MGGGKYPDWCLNEVVSREGSVSPSARSPHVPISSRLKKKKREMWTEGLKCIKQLLKRNSFCLSKEQTDTPKTVRISVGVIAAALQG